MTTIHETTPKEFLLWATKSALDLGLKTIQKTGRFGKPIFLALAEDGTHHISTLAFWSYREAEESMEMLRKLIDTQNAVACVLFSQGRVRRGGELDREVMVLLKSEKGRGSTMEVYGAITNEEGALLFSEPDIMEDVSGRLTSFWEPASPEG